MSVALFGDSIIRGGGVLPGWPQIAITQFPIAASGMTLGIYDYSVNGQRQTDGAGVGTGSYNTALATIPGSKFRFAYWQGWSQNDGVAQQTFIDAFDVYVTNFIALCQANQMIPVIATHIPTTVVTNATQDGYRRTLNTQIRALSGIVLVDQDLAMTDGALPARITAGLSDDGQHPNPAGQAIMSQVFVDAIAAYLASH